MEKVIEFSPLDMDYITDESGNPLIRLFGKTAKRSVLVLDRVRPYFYLIPAEGTNLERLKRRLLEVKVRRKARVGRVEKVSEEIKKEKGKEIKVLKVEVTHPADLKVTERIKAWEEVKAVKEFDIPFCRKYLIDQGIIPMSKIRLLGSTKPSEFGKIDEVIELREIREIMTSRPALKLASFDLGIYKKGPNPERDPIEMISIVSDQFERVLAWKGVETKSVEVLEGEKEMIRRFVEIIRELDPDLLIAYNSDLFEFPYLCRRARENGLELRIGKDNSEVRIIKRGRRTVAKIKGRIHVDLFPIIERHVAISRKLKSEVYTLDNIAYELLWEKKRELEETNLSEYCLEGSRRIMKLAKELLPLEYEFSNLVNQPLFDTTRLTMGQLLEWYLILNSHQTNELVPRKPEYEERIKRKKFTYKGAVVFPPKVGLHENIAIFDFHSLYPSIIVSKNIDPSTIDCECCSREEAYATPDGAHHFCKQRTGLIPRVIEDVLNRRERIKKILEQVEKDSPQHKILFARQHALKTITNASYGYLAFFGARWYDKECASSITAFGRSYVKKIIEMAEREGFEVIYSDTDSCFVKVKA